MTFEPASKEDLLELWRRIFPRSFTVPIEQEANGQGLDVYAQQAAIFARAAEAAAITTQAYYILPHSSQVRPEAQGELAAEVEVQVSRLAPAVGPITLDAGVQLLAIARAATGEEVEVGRFGLEAAVTLPAGSLAGGAVNLRASRPGYQGNVPAGSITRFAELGRATIDPCAVEAGNVLRDNGTPDLFTVAMVGRYVRLVGGLNGGTFPRKILFFTEGTTNNTVVVDGPPLLFPDTVSCEVEEYGDLGLVVSQPDAAEGGRHGWLDADGNDRNIQRVANEADDAYRRRIVALADTISPAAIVRACNRVLSPYGIGFAFEEPPFPTVRFFRVRVAIRNWGEYGFPYDAYQGTPAQPPAGPNAYDAPVPRGNFYDGQPVVYNQIIQQLINTLDATKGAGVDYEIVYDVTL